MKSYVLGVESDRVLAVKKVDGQYVVTIKVKDVAYKCVELPPKRFVFFFFFYVLFYSLNVLNCHRTRRVCVTFRY